MKKNFIFLAIFLMVSHSTFAMPDEESVFIADAYWNGNTVAQRNIDVRLCETESSPATIEYQAKRAWKIDASSPKTDALLCNIDDNYIYELSPEKTVFISVEYLDKGFSGFALCYETQEKKKNGEYVQFYNSGEWKTHTFILYDALLANGLNGVDFILTTNDLDIMGKAMDPIAIASVKIELSSKLSPYDLKVESGRFGNYFFEDEKIEFVVKYKDITRKHACKSLAYTVTNENGKTVYSQTKKVSGIECRIDIPSLPYGVYELNVTAEGTHSYQTKTVDFSHSRKADETNNRFGTNLHYDWVVYSRKDIESLTKLVKYAGYSLVRTSLRWKQIETEKGQYVMDDNILYSNQCLKNEGLKMVAILSQENPLYGTYPYWFEEKEQLDAYARYCYFIVDALKDYTNIFTYPNEFNLTKGGVHNPDNFKQSLAISNAAYSSIKHANPEAFIVSGAVSYYYESYLDSLFAGGLGDISNATSIHLYDFIGGPETYYTNKPTLNVYPHTKLFKDYMRKNCPENKAWITENGWCSHPSNLTESEAHANFFMSTENEQARFYARSFIINSDPERIDKFFHYDFVNNYVGYFDRESNFGIIRAHTYRTPFAAKPAFVAVAAFNDIVGNAKFKASIEEQDLPEDERNHFAYLFETKQGEEIACFWQRDDRLMTDKKIKTFTYKSDAPFFEVYDMYGNRKIVENKEGGYTSIYNCHPIYIKGVKEINPW